MKYFISYLLILISVSLFMIGCADMTEDLTQPQEVNVHGDENLDPSSENFHAQLLSNKNLSDCQRCHAADFSGGTANISCATPECHPTIDVHQTDVFHPGYLASKEEGTFFECSSCHGEDFSGGAVSPTCVDCHTGIDVHEGNYKFPSGENFHGQFIADNDAFYACAECHGLDFSGGLVATTCADCHEGINLHVEGSTLANHPEFIAETELFFECSTCHGAGFEGGLASPTCQTCHSGIGVHKTGINNKGHENFHGNFIRTNNWQLNECASCHGEDYSGGEVATTSCMTCHTAVAGPEACNTCHGDFNDIRRIAPPQGTANETETTDPAVGAHQLHLVDLQLRDETSCSECHMVVTTFDAEGHIDNTERSELIFGTLANGGPTEAVYDFDEHTCQNNYCHGNFVFKKSESAYPSLYAEDEIVGNNFSPIWNKVDGTQGRCGTCHGEIDSNGELVTPLPQGHFGDFELEDCVSCHTDVVDANGVIIDEEKHINGVPNVFGNL